MSEDIRVMTYTALIGDFRSQGYIHYITLTGPVLLHHGRDSKSFYCMPSVHVYFLHDKPELFDSVSREI